ncbi:hypothetical protein BYT27DRAFT_7124695, partial [Phlegmacium glaucopus]
MPNVTIPLLSDILPSSVPMLEADGNNWAMFYVHFRGAVEARGFWSHFNGPLSVPVLSTEPTAAEIAVKGQWDRNETFAKTLLTQCLPDSIVMEVYSKETVRERWEAVVKGYGVTGVVYAETE